MAPLRWDRPQFNIRHQWCLNLIVGNWKIKICLAWHEYCLCRDCIARGLKVTLVKIIICDVRHLPCVHHPQKIICIKGQKVWLPELLHMISSRFLAQLLMQFMPVKSLWRPPASPNPGKGADARLGDSCVCTVGKCGISQKASLYTLKKNPVVRGCRRAAAPWDHPLNAVREDCSPMICLLSAHGKASHQRERFNSIFLLKHFLLGMYIVPMGDFRKIRTWKWRVTVRGRWWKAITHHIHRYDKISRRVKSLVSTDHRLIVSVFATIECGHQNGIAARHIQRSKRGVWDL